MDTIKTLKIKSTEICKMLNNLMVFEFPFSKLFLFSLDNNAGYFIKTEIKRYINTPIIGKIRKLDLFP